MIDRSRDAVELRIKKTRNGCICASEPRGLCHTRFAQRMKGMLKEPRAETAIAVFHRNARAGRKMISTRALGRKDGSADDARAMTQSETNIPLRLQPACKPGIDHGQRLMQRRAPHRIETKTARNYFTQFPFTFGRSQLDGVVWRQSQIQLWQLGEIPRKPHPLNEFHKKRSPPLSCVRNWTQQNS
jgi:hypothetical protein